MKRSRVVNSHRDRLIGLIGIAAALGLLWAIVVVAPSWFVRDQTLEGLKAQNEVRTTLLQGLGGLVLLVGAYFTYRQLHIAREGQITERYTRAIDQLGHVQLDVRLGGIYALERIARDSPGDRRTIGEVLTAFVRRHAPWPPSLPGNYRGTAPIDQVPDLHVRAPDVQATLTVLGRGGFALSKDAEDRLDLREVDLRRADLDGAHLEHANLLGAHLESASLDAAHLEWADLGGAHLEHASLLGTHLDWARLGGTRLEDANLSGVHCTQTIFYATHLEGANISRAHLSRALGVESCYLEGAVGQDTEWPVQFDWRAAGVHPLPYY
jgi:Pentapeptide repeats (8 copies)